MAQTAKTEIEAAVGKAVSNVSAMRRRAGAKASEVAEQVSETVEEAIAETKEVMRAVAETALDGPREVGLQAASQANEIGQVFVELSNEQSRHGLQTFRALVSTIDWEQAATIQADFVRTSVERGLEFCRRYMEIALATQAAFASLAEKSTGKS